MRNAKFLRTSKVFIRLKNIYCMIKLASIFICINHALCIYSMYFTCYLRLFINHAHVYENFKVLLLLKVFVPSILLKFCFES